RRGRAVDDCRERHPPSGDAAGRRGRPHARIPAVGEPPRIAQDDRSPPPGHRGARHPGGRGRRRDAGARHLRQLLGQDRSRRGRRRRPTLPRRVGPAAATQDAARRVVAPRLRLRLRGEWELPRRIDAPCGPHRMGGRCQRHSGVHGQSIACAVRHGRRDHGPGRRRRDTLPARFRSPDRGARRLAGAHRDEHRGGAAARLRRAAGRLVHQAPLMTHRLQTERSSSMAGTTYETLNDLPESARAQVIDLLNQRLADAIDLQTQMKQAHWNVKGPQFIALHKLFDEIDEAVEEYVDLLAERVVQLGGIAEGTARIVAERSELPEYPPTIATGEEHVWAVSNALASFGTRIRRAIDETGDLDDSDSADICTEISRGVDKWLWFVEAHAEAAKIKP